MKLPRIRESPPPVLRDEDLQRLLSSGNEEQGFEDGRGYTLFRVFFVTGARLLAGAGAAPRLGHRTERPSISPSLKGCGGLSPSRNGRSMFLWSVRWLWNLVGARQPTPLFIDELQKAKMDPISGDHR